jgi:hypothetical protein
MNLCSSQDLIMCNGLMKRINYNKMNCIDGLGSSVMDYVVSNILLYNQVIKIDLLNDHDFDSDDRSLSLTLNFVMHKSSIKENYDKQRHSLFNKNKVPLFLKNLNNELNILSYKNNIEDIYHNFMTPLSTSINKLSIKVFSKRKNRTSKNWYDNECKISRTSIKDSSNESLKHNKIKRYKVLIKRGKRNYINRKQENLLHLSNLDPKRF